jgi:hypothetical protein
VVVILGIVHVALFLDVGGNLAVVVVFVAVAFAVAILKEMQSCCSKYIPRPERLFLDIARPSLPEAKSVGLRGLRGCRRWRQRA